MRIRLKQIAAFCAALWFTAGCEATGNPGAATLAAAVTRPPPLVELDESADGGEFRIALGQTIALSLRENPTTGFRWELGDDGHPACVALDQGFTESTTGGVGRGGTRRWFFKAAAAGSCQIALGYRRAWEKREPERTIRFRVLVSP